MIHWGIIGAGNIAHRFAASLQYEKNSQLYAISGRNKEKLSAFQQEHNCEKVYVGHEKLLEDENVDAVYIALPHHLHAKWVIRALQAHKAVLCEKPAAVNALEMKEIIDIAQSENVLFMEAMKSRFEPAYQFIKEQIGRIGNIQFVKAENSFLLPQESYGKTYHTQNPGGGVLLDSGCYCVNIVNDFLKGDVVLEKLYANTWNGIDMYIDAKLTVNHIPAEITAAFDRKGESSAVIIGDKGQIEIVHPHRPDKVKLTVNDHTAVYEIPYEHDDFYAEIHHFAQLYLNGYTQSPVMSFADSLRNAEIMDLIHSAYTDYTKEDLAVLEAQEKCFACDHIDVQQLAEIILDLQKEYDRGIALRIVKEPENRVIYEHVMKDKSERNLQYAEGKHNAIYAYGHSSAWVNISMHCKDFKLKEGVLPSGGAFPVFNTNGELIMSILISGLHEGKDHELIVRALSSYLHKDCPEFKKAIG